jgi:hypothetical protein
MAMNKANGIKVTKNIKILELNILNKKVDKIFNRLCPATILN